MEAGILSGPSLGPNGLQPPCHAEIEQFCGVRAGGSAFTGKLCRVNCYLAGALNHSLTTFA
jgi:hypothetical protein